MCFKFFKFCDFFFHLPTMAKENYHVHTTFSTLTKGLLDEIIKSFHISSQFKPFLPYKDQPINISPQGYVSVYVVFFRYGLRLPTFEYLNSVITYYKLHITQITPNGFKKIMCFMLLNRVLNIVMSHHFCVTMARGYWISFSLRSRAIGICDRLPTSIRKW